MRVSDEAEGAGDHLITVPPTQRAHAEVECSGAAGDGHRVLDLQPGGELALEAVQHRAEGQAPRPKGLQQQRLLPPAELGLREGDLLAALLAHGSSLFRQAARNVTWPYDFEMEASPSGA